MPVLYFPLFDCMYTNTKRQYFECTAGLKAVLWPRAGPASFTSSILGGGELGKKIGKRGRKEVTSSCSRGGQWERLLP